LKLCPLHYGIVRLLPVAERAKPLFGEDGAQAVATRLEQAAALGANPLQGVLCPELETTPKVRGRGARGRGKHKISPEPIAPLATTLGSGPAPTPDRTPGVARKRLGLAGTVPPEVWNRLGTTILPKLRSGSDLVIELECTVTVPADRAGSLATELRQILQELGLGEAVRVEEVGLTNQ